MINHVAVTAQIELWQYLESLVDRRTAEPQDDMISALCLAEIDDGDGTTRRLTHDEVTGFSSLLFNAGTETVGRLLGNAAVILAEHPEQRAELAADAVAPAERGRGAAALRGAVAGERPGHHPRGRRCTARRSRPGPRC